MITAGPLGSQNGIATIVANQAAYQNASGVYFIAAAKTFTVNIIDLQISCENKSYRYNSSNFFVRLLITSQNNPGYLYRITINDFVSYVYTRDYEYTGGQQWFLLDSSSNGTVYNWKIEACKSDNGVTLLNLPTLASGVINT